MLKGAGIEQNLLRDIKELEGSIYLERNNFLCSHILIFSYASLIFSYSCIVRSSKSHVTARIACVQEQATHPVLTVALEPLLSLGITGSVTISCFLGRSLMITSKNNVTCCFPPILSYLSLCYLNRAAPHFLCFLILAVSMATLYPPVVTAGTGMTFTVCSDLVAILLFPEHRPCDK